MIAVAELPQFTTTMTKYYEDRVSVKCVCGLVYLGGNGEPGDPLLSAQYNATSGILDSCKVCETYTRVSTGTYTHNKSGEFYVVLDIVENTDTDEVMVLYAKPGVGRFVRSVANFNERFTKVSL